VNRTPATLCCRVIRTLRNDAVILHHINTLRVLCGEKGKVNGLLPSLLRCVCHTWIQILWPPGKAQQQHKTSELSPISSHLSKCLIQFRVYIKKCRGLDSTVSGLGRMGGGGVVKIMILRVPQEAQNFLTSWATINFSKTPFHTVRLLI
jgi:hypothetical protein